MAFMSQERKKELSPSIKAVCKKYGVKASLSVRHHSVLVLSIKSGKVDFMGDSKGEFHYQINEYWLDKFFGGESLNFLKEVKSAMMNGNHDNSDPMVDYFDVGWYIDIKVGDYDKPYLLTV